MVRSVPATAQALGYLHGAGPKAAPVVALTWGLLILSIIVVVIVSALVLVGALVWTVVVLAAVNAPTHPPALTIKVTGQQWRWKARYMCADPSQVFVTADELHIPVGVPVHIRLIGAEVLHSFSVPALTGKMEVIPGQINETWIEASHPGVFHGRCAEYCGAQHAHMAFLPIADTPKNFAAWRAGNSARRR